MTKRTPWVDSLIDLPVLIFLPCMLALSILVILTALFAGRKACNALCDRIWESDSY